jgi:hypothetical protein
VHRVFDCVGSGDGRPMTLPSALPSASDNGIGTPEDLNSQLNGWPACAPDNNSPPALQPSTHDSGSGWLAGPSRCDPFIHDSLPVSRRTARLENDAVGDRWDEPAVDGPTMATGTGAGRQTPWSRSAMVRRQ